MRDVIRELHLFTVAQRAVPWAKGSSWAVEGSSVASGIWCLSTQRELLPAGGWLSPAFFQNNLRSKQCFRWHYNIYQAQYLQRDNGAKMPVWGTSAALRDAAGQASPPFYSKCSSAPEAHQMSPNLHAENNIARWEESQALEAMFPRWAARQRRLRPTECLRGQRHTAPQPLWCHSTEVLRTTSDHLLWVQLKTYPPPPHPQNTSTEFLQTCHMYITLVITKGWVRADWPFWEHWKSA